MDAHRSLSVGGPLAHYCRPVTTKFNDRLNKETVMKKGTVTFFNNRKGFGFIEPDDGSADVFVDISAVACAGMTALKAGQRISFDLVKDPKKREKSAQNLRLVLDIPIS